jgi:hypothetical protein
MEREEKREQFRQAALAIWTHFQTTGLHVTAQEASIIESGRAITSRGGAANVDCSSRFWPLKRVNVRSGLDGRFAGRGASTRIIWRAVPSSNAIRKSLKGIRLSSE